MKTPKTKILIFIAFIITQLLLGQVSSLVAQETFHVTAKGIASSENAAIENAKRQAIEIAVGSIVGSETIVKNYKLFSDQIVSRSMGYLLEYDVISSTKLPRGDKEVVIKAKVGTVIDQLLQDKIARELLLNWMDKPRVLVLIAEENNGDSLSIVSENTISSILMKNGFPALDRSNLPDGIPIGSMADKMLERLYGLHNELDVELILAGRAVAAEGNTPDVMKKAKMVSVQAEINAKLIQADTGEILSTRRAQATKPHINKTNGGAEALEESAIEVTEKIIEDVLLLWSTRQSNTVPVEIYFEGISYSKRDAILDDLTSMNDVKEVNERGFKDGTFNCRIGITTDPAQLASQMDGELIAGHYWSVTEVTTGRIILVVTE